MSARKSRPRRPSRIIWLLPALVLATLVAYQPAWHGGLLWDDDAHLTAPALRSAHGLWRIWFDVGATQQYYPVVHSVFWLLYRLVGEQTLGYHLVTIGLHATSAFLFALILRRLKVPGAGLAGVIFALHPVHVESVAWITEIKNTLSTVCYLGAALAYLRFDRDRSRRAYALALGLFVLALLSKTVTAALPAGLLVVFWWQRGRVDWRRDVAPLAPLFVLGLASGLLTAWVEHTFIGAQGDEFQATLVERGLIAGRAIWFYLATLVWPVGLTFNYPRWSVSQQVWWQYLYPMGVATLFALLWRIRTGSRAPLAALLFFCVTLFPALGFVNVYPFRYAFVADHFQYLASLGIIALAAAGLASLWSRLTSPRAPAAALVVAIGALLGVLTWRQAHQYASAETLYRATIARNPASWMAHNNLAVLELRGSGGELADAVIHIREAIRLNPNNAEAHNNLGLAWQRMGRFTEAAAAAEDALRLKPTLADAHYNLALALEALGRLEPAVAHYLECLRINPSKAEAHHNLANVLQRLGRVEEAVTHLREGVRLFPDSADIYQNLGNALHRLGRLTEAIAAYQDALRLQPGFGEVRNNLGFALQQAGRLDEALAQFQESVRQMPGSARVRHNLANLLSAMGRPDDALEQYRQAVALDPGAGAAVVQNDWGLLLAKLARYQEAAAHFAEALRIKPDFDAARANLSRALAAIKGRG